MRKLLLLLLITFSCDDRKENYLIEKTVYEFSLSNIKKDSSTVKIQEEPNTTLSKVYYKSRVDYYLDSLRMTIRQDLTYKFDSLVSIRILNAEKKEVNTDNLIDKKEQDSIALVVASKLFQYDKDRIEYSKLSSEDRNRISMISLTKESYEKNLSSLDGSLEPLKELVKQSLNNPKSFEHVETGYKILSEYVEVKMIYKAQNGFGAIITKYITVRTDGSGKIIDVIDAS